MTLGGWACSPHFFVQEKEKRQTKEKRKTSKAKTIKRLSPSSKCYCFSHSRVSRIQKCFLSANHGGWQYVSVFHDPSTLEICFTSPDIMILTSSWPLKWKKIGSAKKLLLNLGIYGEGCTFKYFKIKKDLFITRK